jgi:xyloglucan:xyloglucosyl transferase
MGFNRFPKTHLVEVEQPSARGRASCRFYIDDTPIREMVRTESMGAQFPSKPMSLYATIWDGSSWATSGGRYKVDYKYAPYVAEFADLALRGCAAGPAAACATSGGDDDAYDRLRYPAPLPECSVGAEAAAFLPSGDARAALHRHGRRSRMRRGADFAV